LTDFIPALRFRALTRLYDPLVRATVRESAFKRALVDQVRARAGARLLDLGCGTGTLTVQLARAHPEAGVWPTGASPAMRWRRRASCLSGCSTASRLPGRTPRERCRG